MRKFYKLNPDHGVPNSFEDYNELFLPAEKERVEKILCALNGLRICTALSLLKKVGDALLQSDIAVD